MQRIIILSSLCLSIGCGEPTPDYVTEYGIEVFDTVGLTETQKKELDVGVAMTESLLESNGHQTKSFLKSLKQSKLNIVADEVKCARGCDSAVGTYSPSTNTISIAVLNEQCPVGTSSYMHELLHVWLYGSDIDDNGDKTHSRDNVWSQSDGYDAQLSQEFFDVTCLPTKIEVTVVE